MHPALRLCILIFWMGWCAFGCNSEEIAESEHQAVQERQSLETSHRIASLDESPYGLNSHRAQDELLTQFAGIGIRWHRIDLDWRDLEPQQGQFHWTYLDRLVTKADSLGLSLYGDLAYAPTWASGSASQGAPPKTPRDFIDFVRVFVRRYRGKFACLGIWNEPNLRQFWSGDKSTFIYQIFLPGVRAIREETPEQPICGPDTTGEKGRDEWLAPILAVAGQYLDVITHHQYDGDDKPNGRAEEIDDLHKYLVRKGYANWPLWITEIGWSTPGVSRQTQAQYLTETMRLMRTRPWWKKTFWYDSHGPGWGLVGTDGPSLGQPSPAFFAYRDVIARDPTSTAPRDAAKIVSHTMPFALRVGQSVPVSVTVANTGTSTWTSRDGYKFGAVKNLDPTAPGRVELAPGTSIAGSVANPAAHTFNFNLVAPAAPGTYLTSWQMVKEDVHWFGPLVAQSVVVTVADAPPAPNPNPPPVEPKADLSKLAPNEFLLPTESRKSLDGRFVLLYQGDGNLVLSRGSTFLWASGTAGASPGRVVMQGDGNLAIYNASNRAVWTSKTAGNPGAYLRVQNDGNVVLYTPTAVLWETHTGGQ